MSTHAKKELGQHWLHDASILEAIARAGNVSKGDRVLEIGPGLGTLTDVLVSCGAETLALEFDQDLLGKLEKKFKNTPQVTVQYGDIRNFDFRTLHAPYKIVANIPYYLTSHLIRSISETLNPPEVAVLLIQKEVAQRLCARPGQMSILAVTAQYYFDCQLDIEVAASYFTPPPKVDSQVVVLTRKKQKPFVVDEKFYFRVVKAGFSEKRKTLRNSLSGGLSMSKQEAESLLSVSGIKLSARAQELSLEDWYKLYLNYASSIKSN